MKSCLVCDLYDDTVSDWYLCPQCAGKVDDGDFRSFIQWKVRLELTAPDLHDELAASLPNELLEQANTAVQDRRYLLFRDIHYNKFQESFLYSKAHVQLVTAGNQVGKTHCGGYKCAEFIAAQTPYDYPEKWPEKFRFPAPVRIIIGVSKFSRISPVLLPKFREYFPHWPEDDKSNDKWVLKRNGEGQITDGRYLPTGSSFKIIAKSQSSEGSDDAEGFQAEVVWFDEPPLHQHYTGALRGIMVRKGLIMITATPLTESGWMMSDIAQQVASDPGIEMYRWSIWENAEANGGPLTKATIMRLLDAEHPDERHCRETGEFMQAIGSFFSREMRDNPGIFRQVEYDNFDEDWLVVSSMDWHLSTPARVLYCAINGINQHVFFDELILENKTFDEIADEMQALEEAWGVKHIKARLVDKAMKLKVSAIRNDNSEVWNAFREMNLTLTRRRMKPMTPIQGAQSYIPLVRSLLVAKTLPDGTQYQPIIIGHHCEELRKTLPLYKRATYKSGEYRGESKDFEADKRGAFGAHMIDTFLYTVGQQYTWQDLVTFEPERGTYGYIRQKLIDEGRKSARQSRRKYRRRSNVGGRRLAAS